MVACPVWWITFVLRDGHHCFGLDRIIEWTHGGSWLLIPERSAGCEVKSEVCDVRTRCRLR